VSCGTCMDQLKKYEFEKIFPGCRLLDIHEYLLEKGVTLGSSLPAQTNVSETNVKQGGRSHKGVRLDGVRGTRYLYHEPCHAPMQTISGIRAVNELMGQEVLLSDRCCGESGTLAVTRPDISTQVRFRKQAEIESGAAALRSEGYAGAVKILTSCPSCLQGLSRYNDDAATQADYIVVEMARTLLGDDWMDSYVRRVNDGGIERVLL